MKEALKPCPHCGEEAKIIIEHGKVFAECQRCGARSGWYGTTFDNPQRAFEVVINAAKMAADSWNKRHEAYAWPNDNL